MIRPKPLLDRRTLLATVSSAALALAWGPQARAADLYLPGSAPIVESGSFRPSAKIWVAVEGRYNMFTNSGIFGDISAFPGDLNADPDDGWGGGLELGARPAGSAWDYVARLIYGRANGDGDVSGYVSGYGTVYASASVEEEHIVADFEAGRNIGVGLLGNTRIHGGVRFVHFDAALSGTDYDTTDCCGATYVDLIGSQKITAIGPRIGIDQRVPLTGNLFVDLSAAGAVLFGQRDVAFAEEYSSEIFSDSDGVTVWNAEASAGLTYMMGRASATLGYRVDAFWDLYRGDFGEEDIGGGGDRITHGPFAKLKIYTSGGDEGSYHASGMDSGNLDGADIWVAAHGRYNMFTDSSIFGTRGVFEEYAYLNADPNDGWSGGLELGARAAGSPWDYVGRLIYGKADGDDEEYITAPYYTTAFASVEEEHIIADFEVGRHIGVGMLGDTRIHAGVRFVHFDATLSGNDYASYDPYYGDISASQKITAFGPRIGIDQRIPVSNNLFVDLGAAGAVLFGQRDLNFIEELDTFYSDSECITVWNAEASAGLTYAFGQASATVGYRIDAFWDLYGSAGDEFSGGNRITHGPFAQLKINLSGGDH